MLEGMRKRPSPSWPPPAPQAPRCALCGREGVRLTEHHLVPKSQGRRRGVPIHALPTALLCPACHKFLHKTFSNAELETQYNSVDKLLAHEGVARFVAWLRKQPASKGVRVK